MIKRPRATANTHSLGSTGCTIVEDGFMATAMTSSEYCWKTQWGGIHFYIFDLYYFGRRLKTGAVSFQQLEDSLFSTRTWTTACMAVEQILSWYTDQFYHRVEQSSLFASHIWQSWIYKTTTMDVLVEISQTSIMES